MSATPSPVRTSRRIDNVTYAVRDVVLWAREAAAAGKDLIYLNIGDPIQFDFRTPEHVVEAIVTALRANRTAYAPSEGIPEAVEAIREDAEVRKGIRSVQSVLVGHGASEPIEILFSALVDPGESVLVPSPGYPLYGAVLAKLDVRQIPYYLDENNGWQPDPDEIAAKVDAGCRAIVLINPNNPTGSVASRDTLMRVLEIADRHDLVVLSDEIYDRLLLDDDAPMIATGSLRDDLPIATFYGMSKVWLGPGLRVGWCVLSGPAARVKPLADGMMRLARARVCASYPAQCAVAPALRGSDAHLRECNAKLLRRRDITRRALAEIPGFSLTEPKAAFYAFPRFDLPIEDIDLVKGLIMEEGVVLVHGSGFGQVPGTKHVRIVFLPEDERLQEAYRRMAAYVSRLGR